MDENPNAEQELFLDAVINDKDMTVEQKLHWAKVCADDYLERLQAAETDLADARAALRLVEWCASNEDDEEMYCPVCGSGKDTGGHMNACAIGKALAATEDADG